MRGDKNTQRVALVTGANRGIGLEVSRQLAALGMHVLLTARDGAKAERAAGELRASGRVDAMALDVTQDGDVESLAAWVGENLGRIDVLVNNAGVLLERGRGDDEPSVFDVGFDVMRASFETNTLGPLRVARAFIPLMRQAHYGRIVNVSSGMGQLSEMGGSYPAYRLSKAALNAVTRILNAELEGTGIKVNSVCPGWVRTEMGGPNATRSVEKGAESIVWLATLPDSGPSGGFFRDRQAIAW